MSLVKHKAFLFLFFLSCIFSALGQPSGSLQKQVDSLNSLFKASIGSDPVSAKQLAGDMLRIALRTKNNRSLGTAYLNLGIVSIRSCSYDTAIAYYEQALAPFVTEKDQTSLARTYMGLGTANHFLGNHDEALQYFFKALKIYESDNDKVMTVKALSNLGMVYEGQKQFKKALDVYERCQQINAVTGDSVNIADCQGNIGKVLFQLKNYKASVQRHLNEAEIRTLIQDTASLCYTYDNLSSAYAMMGQIEKALYYQKEALRIYTTNEDKAGVANSLCNLGGIYIQKNEPGSALDYLQKAVVLARETDSKLILASCYETLVETYVKLGDHKQAFEYLEKASGIKDSLFTSESSRQMAAIEALYKTEKLSKEKLEAEKLSSEMALAREKTARQRNYSIAGAFVVVLLLSGIFYISLQRRRQQQEKEQISAMLLSEEKERTRIARELHDGLGQLLSTARINAASLEDSVTLEDQPILRNTLDLLDQSVSEVRTVSHNLMPQLLSDKGLVEALGDLVNKTNTSKHLQVEFIPTVETALAKNVEITLYRIVQEVLNNMIRHSEASRIILKLNARKNNLSIYISDNGKGFEVSAIEKSEGLGWKNILARVSLINGKFSINSAAGKGTTVIIDVSL